MKDKRYEKQTAWMKNTPGWNMKKEQLDNIKYGSGSIYSDRLQPQPMKKTSRIAITITAVYLAVFFTATMLLACENSLVEEVFSCVAKAGYAVIGIDVIAYAISLLP